MNYRGFAVGCAIHFFLTMVPTSQNFKVVMAKCTFEHLSHSFRAMFSYQHFSTMRNEEKKKPLKVNPWGGKDV